MLNPFFLQGSQSEQNLVQDLINEQLRMYGVEVYYMPREYVTTNTVIKEVIESRFTNTYPIEAYVDSYEGYGGQGTLLSKFGIQNYDDLKLIISKDRYENYIAPLAETIPNGELTSRPKEGDLIYFPLGDRLFEIKYVEHEQPFYQLQKNYVFTLTCSLFRIEDEVIDTGVDTIDDEAQDQGYIQTLQLIGSATTATATATLCSSGAVNSVSITNMGNNYNIAPIVSFSDAPSGGVTATGIATITDAYVNCSGGAGGKVLSIQITNAGCGYTIPPNVKLTTPDGYTGTGAAATSGISTYASVQFITVTDGGGGYISTPTVGISTPKHVGAAATAILAPPSGVGAGVSVVSAPISIGASAHLFPYGTTGGVYYDKAPTVTFSLPTGTGNAAEAAATMDTYALTGGTVRSLAITTEGKFYTSAPTVTIESPGVSLASGVIGLAGSSILPSSVTFTSTGRAYRTAPTVAITTSGTMLPPTQQAVGIATIHPITGIVTDVSFDVSDPWAVGTGATVGSGYTVAPNLIFSGNTSPINATATVTVSVAGTVNSISIGNSGFGYAESVTPTVTISAPAGVTTQFTATGIATIRYDSIKTTGTIGISTTIITGINTTNMIVGDRVRLGTGYSSILPEVQTFPDVTFVTGIGVSSLTISKTTTNTGIKTETVEVGIQNCGIVTGINITYGGGGYLTAPTVTITNDTSEKNYHEEVLGVTTATAGAIVSSASTVSNVYLINGGAQYVLTPEVTIGSPVAAGSTVGFGTYVFNEIVIGSTSGTTARVNSWSNTTNQLEIKIVDGTFTPGETLYGTESGALYAMKTQNKDDLVTPFADNDNIETEGDKIIDFSEKNPFGMP